MPLPRFAKLPEKRQRELLDAARAEFAAHGFSGASFNRIIATTGVSKGAMYYYFADKTDLYEAVLEEVLSRIEESAIRMGPPNTDSPDEFWEGLATRAASLQMNMESDPELAALGHKLYASGVGVQHITDRLSGWVSTILEFGQKAGAVRDDLPLPLLSHAVTGLMMSLDRYFVSQIDLLSLEEMLELSPKAMQLIRDLVGQR